MFQFKQFLIRQENTAMKLGTDSVLLGAWAAIEKSKTILDIGTGTGILACMAAQRNKLSYIDAIEIEQNAVQDAILNIQNSPFKDQIKIHHIALQDYYHTIKYDSIISNPPYFEKSLKNPNTQKKIARHTDTLSFNDLLTHTKRLLAPEGNFSIILPYLAKNSFINLAVEYELYLTKYKNIIPKETAAPKRILMQFEHTRPLSIKIDPDLILLDLHLQKTPEHIAFTKDFYLYD